MLEHIASLKDRSIQLHQVNTLYVDQRLFAKIISEQMGEKKNRGSVSSA